VLTTGLKVGLLIGGKVELNAGGSVGTCPAASFNKRKERKKPAFRGALDVENTMVNDGEWSSNAYCLVLYPCIDLYLLTSSY
jgi:hypothetical protein